MKIMKNDVNFKPWSQTVRLYVCLYVNVLSLPFVNSGKRALGLLLLLQPRPGPDY